MYIIGFWCLFFILLMVIAYLLGRSDAGHDGYNRGYIDGSYKIPNQKNPKRN